MRPTWRHASFGVGVTVASTALLTAALAPLRHDVGLLNTGLPFLLLTLVISATWGLGVGAFAAVLTSAAVRV
jgi:hypothetical protein